MSVTPGGAREGNETSRRVSVRTGNPNGEETIVTRGTTTRRRRFSIRRARLNSSPIMPSMRIVIFESIPKMTTFMSKRQIKDLSGIAPSAMGKARD
jgi:hypothetical protein